MHPEISTVPTTSSLPWVAEPPRSIWQIAPIRRPWCWVPNGYFGCASEDCPFSPTFKIKIDRSIGSEVDITLLKYLLNRRWPIFSLTYRHRPSPSMTPSLRLSFPGRVCRSVPCRHRLPPRLACAQWLRSHTPRPRKKKQRKACDPNDSSLIFENFLSFEFFFASFSP